jgi:transcriptional regulator with XRE-family HTH domain
VRRVVPTPFADDPQVTEPAQFGATIRAARTNAGLTLEDAALLAGVSKQTLSDLENARASVGLTIALKIANQFGIGLFAVAPGQADALRHAIKLSRAALPANNAMPPIPAKGRSPRRQASPSPGTGDDPP